jgi:hypothetical protein
MVQVGYGGRKDPAEARRVLEAAAKDNASAKIALADLLRPNARVESDYARIERLYRDALRLGLADDEAADVRAKMDALPSSTASREKRQIQTPASATTTTRPARRERPKAEASVEACRGELTFNPLEVLGLYSLTDFTRDDVGLSINRFIAQKVRRLNASDLVAMCDTLMRGSPPPSLMTQYGFVMMQWESDEGGGRDYGQSRNTWPDLFRRAAEQGELTGMLLYGLHLRSAAASGGQSWASGTGWIERARQQGLDEAAIYLALPHLLPGTEPRQNFRRDPARGHALLVDVADLPIPLVKWMLALIYNSPENFGLPRRLQDPVLANEYYQEALGLGAKFNE